MINITDARLHRKGVYENDEDICQSLVFGLIWRLEVDSYAWF